ncbi:hypothetical protein NFIA_036480 [Paecilomyces variotii No. 5]|uniref:Uncharacterized protein n=1 Tax=Byssochlamys spectabilis (strain No. 5 / NBRC 109023) TaxID=1356009 RepID=V5FTL5_BYSSN|nr:hypothetical protein NFIA_036480 [Paecilomyces variotii No. 5]
MVETRSSQAPKAKGEHQNAAHGDKYHGKDEDSSASESLSSADSDISYAPPDTGEIMPKEDAPVEPEKKEKQQKWRGPPNDDDLTAVHPEQADWSIDNLPDILYVLRPMAAHTRSRAKVPKATYQVFGRTVRDFPVLPRQISSRVEGWRYEAWVRLDRRIGPNDILQRINPKYRATEPDIQMRRSRFRIAFHLGSWNSGPSMVAVARMLESIGIDPSLNSTRGLTPGLIKPELGEAGGRITLPKGWINYDTVNPPRPKQRFRGYLLGLNAAPDKPIALPCAEEEEDDFPQAQKVETEPEVPNAESTSDPESLPMGNEPSVQGLYDGFPPYPDPEKCELAYYDRSLSHVFPKEQERTHMTTTLEEYLQRNNLSYEQYLLERANRPLRQKRPRLTLSLSKGDEIQGSISLSKRLRRSVEGPLKSADSDLSETASEILGKFKDSHGNGFNA